MDYKPKIGVVAGALFGFVVLVLYVYYTVSYMVVVMSGVLGGIL